MTSLFGEIWSDFVYQGSLIVWHPIAQSLQETSPGIQGVLRRPTVKSFPDRSVCIERTEDIKDFCRQQISSGGGVEARENTEWRALRCFHQRPCYKLMTTWKYFDQIGGEEDLQVTPIGWDKETYPHELNSERLPVQVVFWRKPLKSALEKFRDALDQWSDSVKDHGMFADGPARWRRETWRAQRTPLVSTLYPDTGTAYQRSVFRWSKATCWCCDFIVDMSKSGQDTLNCLILAILNFGAENAPISEIRFANFLPLAGPSVEEVAQQEALMALYRLGNRKGSTDKQLKVAQELRNLTQEKPLKPEAIFAKLQELRDEHSF